jgi:hypothetical protein
MVPSATDSAERALFDRVRSSQDLSRSPRLRQLFEYLFEKRIADPNTQLTEERIGIEVFGRSPGYDTGDDTIVRVQISQLRKRLEHYFLSEGVAEPVVIVLPKRSYAPVFQPRRRLIPEREISASAAGPRNWRRISFYLAALSAICLISVAWLLAGSGAHARTPVRDDFWSQLFQGSRQTQLVTSDASLMEICDYLGRALTPAEYIGSDYPNALIDANVADASMRRVLRSIASNFVTNMPDLRVSNRLSLLASSLGGRLNVVFARDFRYQPQTPDNLILLSHKKANPWVGLFEERMNFRYEFDAKEQSAAIVNRHPKPGEEQRYPVQWGIETYAVIAFMRKPVGEGAVLLMQGADTTSVEAVCHLLTDENRIRGLYGRLGIAKAGPVAGFEALLRAKLLRGFVHEYEIVAHRISR